MYHSAYLSQIYRHQDENPSYTMLYMIKCSDLRKYPTYKIRLTHRKSVGFVASGPAPRKFVRLVEHATYATPTYASLTVEAFCPLI